MENQQSQQSGFTVQQPLPNATAVLVLGIISIIGCFCYGVVGLICGIIAIILASKSKKLYASNPNAYTAGSLKNVNAGRICAIIGLSLSILYVLMVIAAVVFVGAEALRDPQGFMKAFE
jgi:predicted RND superfamily exporter protein